MDGGILAGLVLVAGGALVGVANLRWQAWRARTGRSGPRAPALSALASHRIAYCPGVLTGYVGYTDYTAMNVELNDDLLHRSPDEQFVLTGFGLGFSTGMIERVSADQRVVPRTFGIESASEHDRQCLGWLSRMQDKGTDNASPSTENLQRVIAKVARDLAERGPVTMTFWHKVHARENEKPSRSGTSQDRLEALCGMLEEARIRGARLAREAKVGSGPG